MTVLLATEGSDSSQILSWLLTAALWLFNLILVFVIVVWPIWAVVDAARTEQAAWEAIGREKTAWILIVLFATFIGTAIYWFRVRPGLQRHR